MNAIVLDTSAYSAFLRGHEPLKRLIQEVDEILVSPIILGELRAGFLRARRKKQNEDELRTFLNSPRVRVVDLDEETSHRYAAIVHDLRIAGTPIPTNDIWIAASAMQHGARLATTDAHFKKVSQILVQHYEVEG